MLREFSEKIKFLTSYQGTQGTNSDGNSFQHRKKKHAYADARLLRKESGFEKKSSVVQGKVRVRVLELR